MVPLADNVATLSMPGARSAGNQLRESASWKWCILTMAWGHSKRVSCGRSPSTDAALAAALIAEPRAERLQPVPVRRTAT